MVSTKEEAEAIQDRIVSERDRHKELVKEDGIRSQRVIQTDLVTMDVTNGYVLLGFKSSSAWTKSKFPGSYRHYDRLIINGKWHIEVFGKTLLPYRLARRSEDKVEDEIHVSERVTRCMTGLPRTAWKEVWVMAKQIAKEMEYFGKAEIYHKDKVTSVVALKAVSQWKNKNVDTPQIVQARNMEPGLTEEQFEFLDSLNYTQKTDIYSLLQWQIREYKKSHPV